MLGVDEPSRQYSETLALAFNRLLRALTNRYSADQASASHMPEIGLREIYRVLGCPVEFGQVRIPGYCRVIDGAADCFRGQPSASTSWKRMRVICWQSGVLRSDFGTSWRTSPQHAGQRPDDSGTPFAKWMMSLMRPDAAFSCCGLADQYWVKE